MSNWQHHSLMATLTLVQLFCLGVIGGYVYVSWPRWDNEVLVIDPVWPLAVVMFVAFGWQVLVQVIRRVRS